MLSISNAVGRPLVHAREDYSSLFVDLSVCVSVCPQSMCLSVHSLEGVFLILTLLFFPQVISELIPSVSAVISGLNLPLVNFSISSFVSSVSGSSSALVRVVQGQFGAELLIGLIKRGLKLVESTQDLPNREREEWYACLLYLMDWVGSHCEAYCVSIEIKPIIIIVPCFPAVSGVTELSCTALAATIRKKVDQTYFDFAYTSTQNQYSWSVIINFYVLLDISLSDRIAVTKSLSLELQPHAAALQQSTSKSAATLVSTLASLSLL